jgi:hypothetical protein
MLTNLIPSHHAFVLELPGVAEAMVKFDGHHEQLFRTGQLTAYLQGAGFYLIYDQDRRKALVWISGWPIAPSWVAAQDPIDSIQAYIDYSMERALTFSGEGHIVTCVGHRSAARTIFGKMASAEFGEEGRVQGVQFLGLETDDLGDRFDFTYRAFVGQAIGGGNLSGKYKFLRVHLLGAAGTTTAT